MTCTGHTPSRFGQSKLKTGLQGQVTKNLSVTGTVGVETNLGGYSVVKGQLAAKYSWK